MMMSAILLAAAATLLPSQLGRVVDDAKAIDRVVEVSHGHDIPTGILRRMTTEDLDVLRGRHADDTYDYASYERIEAGRVNESFSVEPTGADKVTKLEVKGDFVYRVLLDMPSRRMLVTKNRPVWIERVEIELMPLSNATRKTQNVPVGAWLEPGSSKTIDVTEIARQATVRVYARTEEKNGYGNIDVTLVQARVFDNPESPYADAVASEKAILRGLDHEDSASVRSMAQRIVSELQPAQNGTRAASASSASLDVVAPRPADLAPDALELQAIEDLLTGTEAERRQGLDRLHQLIRRQRSNTAR
jgi:hypothetical protein